MSLALAATLSISAPLIAVGYACPTDGAPLRIQRADLSADGEINTLEHLEVGAHGRTCAQATDADPDDLDVSVSILHTDVAGRSLEASALHGTDPVSTRVRVRDRSVRMQTIALHASGEFERETYPIGVPQRVHITVTYPAGWEVIGPIDSGTSLRVEGDRVIVSRSGVILSGLLDDHAILEVTAIPARGTPSITVEATPLTSVHAEALPEPLLDRDTTAVVGALLARVSDAFDEMVDGTDALQQGVGELHTGAGSLADGAAELAAGTAEFRAGVTTLADGSAELADGAGQLADGTHEVTDGISALANGAGAIDAGLGDATNGAQELAHGAGDLAGGLGQISDGVRPLSEGASALAAGARQLADELAAMGDIDLPNADLDSVDPDELVNVVLEISGGITAVRDDLHELLSTLGPEQQQVVGIAVSILTTLADGLQELATGLATALETLGEVVEGFAAVTGAVEEMAGGTAQLATGIAELEGALGQLSDGADALAQGTTELSSGLGELSSGTSQLAVGMDELDDGAGELAGGARALADGSRRLADGTHELASGTGDLEGGTAALAAGTEELVTGTGSLAEGTSELAEGAAQFPAALRDIGATADRGTDRVALAFALLDASAERAIQRQDGAVVLTTQLVHEGVPARSSTWLLVPVAGLSLILAAGTLWTVRRRRSAR